MNKKNKKYSLSASIICADLVNLDKDIKLLKKGGIDFIHFDVMDGVFVPRLGLFPEMLKALRLKTSIPIDVHMMVEEPEPYIKTFIQAGANYIIVHEEATKHLHRVVKLINESGAKAGVALNPSTPLGILDYLLKDIKLVLLMAINPGVVGHKVIPSVFNKISDLKLKLADYPDILIEVDGGVTFKNAAKLIQLGTDILVCGSQTIFKTASTIDKRIRELKQVIDNS